MFDRGTFFKLANSSRRCWGLGDGRAGPGEDSQEKVQQDLPRNDAKLLA